MRRAPRLWADRKRRTGELLRASRRPTGEPSEPERLVPAGRRARRSRTAGSGNRARRSGSGRGRSRKPSRHRSKPRRSRRASRRAGSTASRGARPARLPESWRAVDTRRRGRGRPQPARSRPRAAGRGSAGLCAASAWRYCTPACARESMRFGLQSGPLAPRAVFSDRSRTTLKTEGSGSQAPGSHALPRRYVENRRSVVLTV